MGQDATKVLLGSTTRSDKPGTTVYDSDPATYLAGLACRLASTGLLSLTKSAGEWVGISLGRSLSDIKRTAVLRAGEGVPIRLYKKRAYATVTITNFGNLLTTTPDSVTVGATVFTAQSGAVTPGNATFRAATSNSATASSLAAQINAHATAGALVRAYANGAVVTVMAIAEGESVNGTIAIAYTDNGGGNIGATITDDDSGFLGNASDDFDDISYATKGTNAYIDDATGKAAPLTYGVTISNAVYVSGPLTGIDEDGNSVACALVDMIGGL